MKIGPMNVAECTESFQQGFEGFKVSFFCDSLATMDMKKHPVVGTWHSEGDRGKYRIEVRPDQQDLRIRCFSLPDEAELEVHDVDVWGTSVTFVTHHTPDPISHTLFVEPQGNYIHQVVSYQGKIKRSS